MARVVDQIGKAPALMDGKKAQVKAIPAVLHKKKFTNSIFLVRRSK